MLNDLTNQNYRIPWLIWIQLIVLLLLFALFYFFTISDDDDAATVSSLPENSSVSSKGFLFDAIQQIDKPVIISNNDSITPLSTNGQHQDGQNQSNKGEIETCSSMRNAEIIKGESSSLSFHPCNIFHLATVAFLKCFGLDSTYDASSNRKSRKKKEN